MLTVPFEAPLGEMEELVAATFAELLPPARIGRHDNFFAMGGDSLRATQVVSRLVASLGLDLPPTTVFRWPTTASLATNLCRLREEQTASLVAKLEQLSPEEAERLLRDLPERDT
jgi:acyl carrier protein